MSRKPIILNGTEVRLVSSFSEVEFVMLGRRQRLEGYREVAYLLFQETRELDPATALRKLIDERNQLRARCDRLARAPEPLHPREFRMTYGDFDGGDDR